jgi:hypothetical protein
MYGPILSANDRLCSYSEDLSFDTCRKPATHHLVFLYDGEMMHGWSCGEHLAIGLKYPRAGCHELGADCGMPGAMFFNPPDCCRVPDANEIPIKGDISNATDPRRIPSLRYHA